MTDRMANALAHIQTAEDVDEWAKKVVEEKFTAYDSLLFVMLELHKNIDDAADRGKGFKEGLELAIGLITEVLR